MVSYTYQDTNKFRRVYLDNGLLALDAGGNSGFLDVDGQVAPFEIPGNGKEDIEIGDCLCPLVGEGILFGLLLHARGGLFGRVWLGCWRVVGVSSSLC